MEMLGFDWPFSPNWLWGGGLTLLAVLAWHGRLLFSATTRADAWKFLVLRALFGILLLFLIARPFLESSQPDSSSVRVVSLVDFSGSMNQLDSAGAQKRIIQARDHLDLRRPDTWINHMRQSFGLVQRLGFSGEDVFSIRENSWTLPESGKSTHLGSALLEVLEDEHSLALAGVTLFSDGCNNQGISPLEVAERYREMGVPVNVVGVGRIKDQGNLSIRFVDAPAQSKAKEELVLTAEVSNAYNSASSNIARLLEDEKVLQEIPFTLGVDESRKLKFSPLTPDRPGRRNYRVSIDPLDGDDDPSDDTDVRSVMILEPDLLSALYLSNQARPLYPFLKRSLGVEKFQLSSLIRLGEETFHARGENLSPEGYPNDPEFWMQYDVVLLDLQCLNELNASLIGSLKQYVRKRGGGLLTFGSPDGVREKLGGVFPALSYEETRAKQSLSLEVLPDPLFSNRKGVNQWKSFLPGNMPAFLITEKNPASLGVVGLRSNFERSALVLQAYGSGKVAYWGSVHDWKRALINEDRAKEFSAFWQGLVEWLGSGSVERIRLPKSHKPSPRGELVSLSLEALGSDFEPSLDALVEANVSGPDDFSHRLQLFPQSGRVGSYFGEFRPSLPGSYRVSYRLRFPDGETLDKSSYLRVEELGLEAKDHRYAERDLRMLANLTGGKFIHLSEMSSDWKPVLSDSLPTLKRRNDLANSWPLFLALFLAAGMEWIWRRKGGLR